MTGTAALQCHIRHESVSTEWTNQMRGKLRLGESSVSRENQQGVSAITNHQADQLCTQYYTFLMDGRDGDKNQYTDIFHSFTPYWYFICIKPAFLFSFFFFFSFSSAKKCFRKNGQILENVEFSSVQLYNQVALWLHNITVAVEKWLTVKVACRIVLEGSIAVNILCIQT